MWPWQKCHVLRITPSPKPWGCLIGSEEFAKGALGRKESESKSGWPLESLDGIIWPLSKKKKKNHKEEGSRDASEGLEGFICCLLYIPAYISILFSIFCKGYNKLLIGQDISDSCLFDLKQPKAWTWKKYLTILQSNGCSNKQDWLCSGTEDRNTGFYFLHIGSYIGSHGCRYRTALFKGDVQFKNPYPMAELYVRSHLILHPELLLEVIHTHQMLSRMQVICIADKS